VEIVLFDGVCALCDRFVTFVIDRDAEARFVFAPLQSTEARALLASRGAPLPSPDGGGGAGPESVVLCSGGRVYERSSAALRVLSRLPGAWKLCAALLVVPPILRDLVYRFVARHRYRWFGRRDECRVPTAEVRARFLENRPELIAGPCP
jgi:predicted DCC family thiol-disulfide oxidoreductase YuxK